MEITYVSLADLLAYTMVLISVVALCYSVFGNKNHKK